MSEKLFCSRDRLVKYEFDCIRLGLWLASGLWLGLGVRCDRFFWSQNGKSPSHVTARWRVN